MQQFRHACHFLQNLVLGCVIRVNISVMVDLQVNSTFIYTCIPSFLPSFLSCVMLCCIVYYCFNVSYFFSFFHVDNHGIPKNTIRHLSIDNHVAPIFQVFRPPYLGINPAQRRCRDSFDIIEKEFIYTLFQ